MVYTQFQDESTTIQQENYSNQGTSTQLLTNVNPITQQTSSWVTPVASEPIVILLCNILIPGLGHVLLGQYKKGIVIWVLWQIINTFVWLSVMLIIGLPLLLIPLIQIFIILYDGYALAQRANKGIPLMEGECATSWATLGVSRVCDQVFTNSNLDQCPLEWTNKMQSLQYTS
jgi:TM2 domain-containing membrane protein YozV